MRKLLSWLLLPATAAVLVACGGGGGSPGTTQQPYDITLRADKTSLPLNISHQAPHLDSPDPYTTTLYVHATTGGAPVPEGTTFSCNLVAGLESGSLYYLGGQGGGTSGGTSGGGTSDPAAAYRSVTLQSNAGSATFHFGSTAVAGVSTVQCSVTNPRDQVSKTASVNITVGGTAGTLTSINVLAQAPGYLGTQGNLSHVPTSVAIQASLTDDSNQPLPDPSAPNLQVSIVPTAASQGAYLVSGTQSGGTLQVRSVAGSAQFTLVSGPNAGPILLQLVGDRADNDVSNGIQTPIYRWYAVDAVPAVAVAPLAASDAAVAVTNNTPVAVALTATGGVAPYTWTAAEPLPNGLSLSSSGVISGTPSVMAGTYIVPVTVTDSANQSITIHVTITVTGLVTPELVFAPPQISATTGTALSYALTAEGGKPPLTWAWVGGVPGLTLDAASGVISGTPTAAGTYIVAVSVTDSLGTVVRGNVTVTVAP